MAVSECPTLKECGEGQQKINREHAYCFLQISAIKKITPGNLIGYLEGWNLVIKGVGHEIYKVYKDWIWFETL